MEIHHLMNAKLVNLAALHAMEEALLTVLHVLVILYCLQLAREKLDFAKVLIINFNISKDVSSLEDDYSS